MMGKMLSTVLCALAGANAGYVAHQLGARRSSDGQQAAPLTVAAPVLNTLLAIGMGSLIPRHRATTAFAVAFGLSLLAGSKIDEAMPGLSKAWNDH